MPKQIDSATNAIIECICMEVRRIKKSNGLLPITTLKKYWEQYGCEIKD